MEGLIVIDKIYDLKPLNVKKKYIFSFNLIFMIGICVLSVMIYIVPYINLRTKEVKSNQHLKSTKDLFYSKSLTNNLKDIGLEDFNKVEYADDTLMIEINSDDVESVFSAIENSQGILSIQYQDNKIFIVLLRGGL